MVIYLSSLLQLFFNLCSTGHALGSLSFWFSQISFLFVDLLLIFLLLDFTDLSILIKVVSRFIRFITPEIILLLFQSLQSLFYFIFLFQKFPFPFSFVSKVRKRGAGGIYKSQVSCFLSFILFSYFSFIYLFLNLRTSEIHLFFISNSWL